MTKDEIMELGFFGDKRYLSNFHIKQMRGITSGTRHLIFPSVENVFMSTKCPARVEEFVNISPLEARKLGRQVELRPDWEEIKLTVMRVAVLSKFMDGIERNLLVNTTDDLIEVNWWHDNFWGDCRCPKCEGVPGQNHLGQALMDARTHLQNRMDTYNV